MQTIDPFLQFGSSLDHQNLQLEQPLGELSMVTKGELDEEAFAISSIQQVLEHNCTLHRNFETLKELHLQLTNSNLQLHKALLCLQDDKNLKHEKELGFLKQERDASIAIVEELEQCIQNLEKNVSTYKTNNEELLRKIEVIKLEKDGALVAKQYVEMGNSRDLITLNVEGRASKLGVVDISHKCKYIELNLGKTLKVAEDAQHELLTITFENESNVATLKKSLQRMEEDILAQQHQFKKHEQKWKFEQQKMFKVIESIKWQDQQLLQAKEKIEKRLREEFESKIQYLKKEEEEIKRNSIEEAKLFIKEALIDVNFEENKRRELKKTLEGEAADLRAILVSVEQTNIEAENRYTQSIKNLMNECDFLINKLIEFEDKEKRTTQIILDLKKENSEIFIEVEGLRTQLNDALSKSHECIIQIKNFKISRDRYEKLIEHLKMELHNSNTLWKQELQKHAKIIEDVKQSQAFEKTTLHILRRKLKETNKLLGTVTSDRNQLLIRTREIETLLNIAHSNRFVCQPTIQCKN